MQAGAVDDTGGKGHMIESAIRFILTHIPVLLFILSFVCAALTKPAGSRAEHYLGWMLLLTVGVDGIWAGLYHLLAPQTAASFIGWKDSPFQFEIGVADFSMGIIAVAAFWRPLDFKAAMARFAALFYAGVAYGHVREVLVAGNFAPGNFGIMFAVTTLRFLILPALVFLAYRSERSH